MAYLQAAVLMSVQETGLMTFETNRNIVERRCSMTVRSLMGILSGKPFYVSVETLTAKTVSSPKFVIAGNVSSAPTCNTHTRDDKPYVLKNEGTVWTQCNNGSTNPIVNAILFKPRESQDEPGDRQISVEDLYTEWWKELVITDQHSAFCNKFGWMLEQLESTWDGHLTLITRCTAGSNLTSRTADTYSFCSLSCRYGCERVRKIRNWWKGHSVSHWTRLNWMGVANFIHAKMHCTLRFWIEYRKLNGVTIWSWGSYQVPRLDECVDLFGDVAMFSTQESNSRYCQVENAEENCNKSAFRSHHGHFCFTRLPLGLKHAPEIFNREMDVLLTKDRWKFALVCWDDMVLFSRTPEEHMGHFWQVSTLLHDAGVT